MRAELSRPRELKPRLQRSRIAANKAMRSQLDAVHAVFALPEVERAADLPPELVGLIGAFLSANAKPADYVSIHALPKVSQAGSSANEGSSSSASTHQQGGSKEAAPVAPDGAAKGDSSCSQKKKDE
jgi:hypothetical protein